MSIFDRFQNQEKKGKDLFLVVGLGNPGSQYEQTKHNIGFHVIDKLAEKYGICVNQLKFRAMVGEGEIKGRRVMLMKPLTYMNLSGEAVREAVNFYKIPQDRFVVIFDDTSLPLSHVRIREKGSHGGHNGIRNIIDQMGTDEFWRIKVGIGEKPNGWDLADYVLAKFGKDDLPLALMGEEKAAEAVELILSRGIQDAMNRINQRAKQKKEPKKHTQEGETQQKTEV